MLPALFAGAKAGDPSQAADRNQPNDRRYRRRKAFNKPVKVKRYTDPACKGDNPVCGAIVYANSGGYIVSSVSLNAKGGQPGGVTLHPSCAEVDVKLKANVKRNGYDTFVVPANCLYKLEINISGGPKKQRDVFLTPGCAAAPYTDGTVTENEWHVNVEWMKGVKPAGADDVPVDKEGNKCSVS